MPFYSAIFALIIYLVILLVAYYPVKYRYRHCNNDSSKVNKIPYWELVIIPLVCSVFNKYVSFGKPISGGDRFNYLQDFNGRLTGNYGFDKFLKWSHIFTDDFYYVIYAVTFICCFISLLSYIICHDTVPICLFILFCTSFILDSFSAFKQCFACAFASIMFAALSYPKSLKREIICIVCIVLACSFHTTGYLLIPIFLIIRNLKKIDFKFVFIAVVLIAVFLQPVMLFIAQHTSSVFQRLSYKITEYFIEDSSHNEDGSSIAFLKGIPYYVATFLGLLNRKKIKEQDDSYDKYLLILCIGSISYACSIVSYWLIRVISILYFPISIAIYKIISSEKNPKFRLLEYIVVVGGMAFFTLRSLILNILNYGGY